MRLTIVSLLSSCLLLPREALGAVALQLGLVRSGRAPRLRGWSLQGAASHAAASSRGESNSVGAFRPWPEAARLGTQGIGLVEAFVSGA